MPLFISYFKRSLSPKSWLIGFLTLILLTCGSVAAVNYWVDPNGKWNNTQHYPLRDWRTAIAAPKLAAVLSQQPPILFIGDSTLQHIALPKTIGGHAVYNLAAPGLSISEIQAMLAFVQKTYQPTHVYIGLTFFNYTTAKNTNVIRDELDLLLEQSVSSKMRLLLQWQTSRDSLHLLRIANNTIRPELPWSTYHGNMLEVKPKSQEQWQYHYDSVRTRLQSIEQDTAKARAGIDQNLNTLRQTVATLKHSGTSITLLLPPLHSSLVVEHFQPNTDWLNQYWLKQLRLLIDQQINVLELWDMNADGRFDENFHDSVHLNPQKSMFLWPQLLDKFAHEGI